MVNLKKALKFRLKRRTNLKYERWWRLKKQKPYHECHHWLESFLGGSRINSYFLVNLKSQDHQDVHYKKEPTEQQIIDWLLETIESMSDCIEELQENKIKTNYKL